MTDFKYFIKYKIFGFCKDKKINIKWLKNN